MMDPRPITGKIRDIVLAQMQALARLTPERRNQMVAAAKAVQRRLEARLRALDPGSFSAQETRVRLVEISGIVTRTGAEWGVAVGTQAERAAVEAAIVGRRGMIDQLVARAPEFEGTIRAVATVEKASGMLDPGLLEYYRVSRETYGMDVIASMRQTLMASALEGDTISQSWAKISDALDMPIWRAERIVRTEHSFSMHRAQMDLVREMFGSEANEEWLKQLISTFDQRTGQDSKFVHQQIRKLNKPFRDNEGRVYQQPPNRPNDREVMVMFPAWADPRTGKMPGEKLLKALGKDGG
jgi:hypothetical protein